MIVRRNLPVYNSGSRMNFSPEYMSLFEFEMFENHEMWRQWMEENWHIGYLAAFLYLTALQLGTSLMRNHPPLRLGIFTTSWNVSLATVSFLGFIRTLPEVLVSVEGKNGFHTSICKLENPNSATSLWGLVFCFLKIFEFGDTLIRIVRKKPIPCFHWFHRMLMCIFCWSAYGANDPAGRWFYMCNYFINFLNYGCYALKMHRPGPRRRHLCSSSLLSFSLILVQIVNVLIGLYIDFISVQTEVLSIRCHRRPSNVFFLIVVHCFDLVLLLKLMIFSCMLKPKLSKSGKSD